MNALVTLNIGGKSMAPKSRDSYIAAAGRWGCEYVEVKDPLVDGIHHFWQKVFVSENMANYDRVLQLDADMLIRHDCPSPFEIAPPEAFGVVSARQLEVNGLGVSKERGKRERDIMFMCGHRDRCVQSWARRLKMKPCPDVRHLNGGFFLYSPEKHQWLWDRLKEVAKMVNYDKALLPEQASLSVILWNTQCDQFWFPHTFNTTAAGTAHLRPQHSLYEMNSFIYHYTGQHARGKRLAGQHWERSHVEAISERLPVDGEWAEIGVFRGQTSSNVLHRRPASKLYMVDSWGLHNAATYSKDKYGVWPQDFYDKCQASAERFARHYDVEVIKGKSEDAVDQFADESLDLVYIDADHSYQEVQKDIIEWEPKVKRGGWLGGHDYDPPWKTTGGVKPAVDEAFGDEVVLDSGCTWWWRKPS